VIRGNNRRDKKYFNVAKRILSFLKIRFAFRFSSVSVALRRDK